jgi:lipopolysaccharide transport protein LptA
MSTATAAFVDGKIATAVAKGTPAFFEQRRGAADKLVRGRAGVIDYDVNKGIVRLSNQVWFSYAGNEFRGNVVVYNIRDERVTVNPAGEEKGRVNITITPRTLDKKPGETPPASGSGDGE